MSWWSSVEVVSALSTILKCFGAVIGVLILVVGFRESTLKGRMQAVEKLKFNSELKDARTRADEAIAKQQPRAMTIDQTARLRSAMIRLFERGLDSQVVVVSKFLDPESESYSRLIYESIPVNEPSKIFGSNGLFGFQGIRIFCLEDIATNSTEKVRKAFQEADIPFSTNAVPIGQSGFSNNHGVFIFVGVK